MEQEFDETVSLARLELEREKSKRSFWQTIIVSGAVVIVVGIISAGATVYVTYLQNKGELSLQRVKAENAKDVELLKAQAELLASFKDEIVSANIYKRVRFAHMFSLLSLDEPSRLRWADYHSQLVESYEEILKKEFSRAKKLYSPDSQLPKNYLDQVVDPFDLEALTVVFFVLRF